MFKAGDRVILMDGRIGTIRGRIGLLWGVTTDCGSLIGVGESLIRVSISFTPLQAAMDALEAKLHVHKPVKYDTGIPCSRAYTYCYDCGKEL